MKTKIARTALELFISEGVKAITMDGIASEMGISKRTIYENFKNKNELVGQCLLLISQKHDECMKELYSSDMNAVDILLDFLVKGMGDNKYVFKFISDVKYYYPDEYAGIVTRMNEKKVDQMTNLLKKGMEGGYFRKDLNIDLLIYIFFKQMEIIFSPNLYMNMRFSESELFISMIVNFTRGISTRKGFDRIEELINNEQLSKSS